MINFRQLTLLAGDIVVLYASLALALTIRYQAPLTAELWYRHFWPFSFVFAGWLIVFYIAEFYNLRALKNNFEFNRRWGVVTVINTALAIAVFYFLPTPSALTPKTNLILFAGIFGVAGFLWRRFYNSVLRQGTPSHHLLLLGDGAVTREIVEQIRQHPQLGYELKCWLRDSREDQQFNRLDQLINQEQVNLIVIPAHLKKDSDVARQIYQNLVWGIEVMDLTALYGLLFQKVPLAELEEVWFLENLTRQRRLYETVKRPLEIGLALILAFIFLLPAALISFAIRITSPGPVFFRQRRVGQNEREFTLYKFRTMGTDAEEAGPQWAAADDARVTPVGRFLRFTHLDEFPQLLNIIRGELSFVGPRPERPEFVRQLKKAIPYYDLRHLVRPGLTGWAQINYRYGSSIEDAYQKLQYDIYYLKNYSFWLDVSILIKTVRLLFTNNR